MKPAAQSQAVQSLLIELEADANCMRKVLFEVVAPAGSAMFPLDLLAFAAVKRHASTTSAFIAMVSSWNMVIARALLRMHIDTSLRFSAAWHVNEPHAFASRVLKGERIDKMKSRIGRPLTDAYLVQLHEEAHPWLPTVYKQLSGYVHFSGSHISAAIETVGNEETDTIKFLVSDQDLKFSEFSWTEVLLCFREATSILSTSLQGWGQTKKLSGKELEALRGA